MPTGANADGRKKKEKEKGKKKGERCVYLRQHIKLPGAMMMTDAVEEGWR